MYFRGELEVCKIYVIRATSISALFRAGGIESYKWDWPDRFSNDDRIQEILILYQFIVS